MLARFARLAVLDRRQALVAVGAGDAGALERGEPAADTAEPALGVGGLDLELGDPLLQRLLLALLGGIEQRVAGDLRLGGDELLAVGRQEHELLVAVLELDGAGELEVGSSLISSRSLTVSWAMLRFSSSVAGRAARGLEFVEVERSAAELGGGEDRFGRSELVGDGRCVAQWLGCVGESEREAPGPAVC